MAGKNLVNVIYITGTGHCGSTLLDMLLDTQPGIASSGEIEMWPYKLRRGSGARCGCGKLLASCPFWMRVSERVNPLRQPAPRSHFFRNEGGTGKVLQWRWLPEIVRGEASSRSASHAETYGQNSREIFEAFRDAVLARGEKVQWIVDNSKTVYRLLWLLQSELFNVKVLHIIKSPRGFVYSATKKMLRNGEAAAKVGATALRKSVSWVLQNQLIARVGQAYLPSENYRLVPYEKLAARPEKTMRGICQEVGVNFDSAKMHDFQGGHAIAGNQGARFSAQQIVLDEIWKERLPQRYQRLTQLITAPVASAYGY